MAFTKKPNNSSLVCNGAISHHWISHFDYGENLQHLTFSSCVGTSRNCRNPGGEHHRDISIPHLEQLIPLFATGQAHVLMTFMLLFSSGSGLGYRRGQLYMTVCSPEHQRRSGKFLEVYGGRKRSASGRRSCAESRRHRAKG